MCVGEVLDSLGDHRHACCRTFVSNSLFKNILPNRMLFQKLSGTEITGTCKWLFSAVFLNISKKPVVEGINHFLAPLGFCHHLTISCADFPFLGLKMFVQKLCKTHCLLSSSPGTTLGALDGIFEIT